MNIRVQLNILIWKAILEIFKFLTYMKIATV